MEDIAICPECETEIEHSEELPVSVVAARHSHSCDVPHNSDNWTAYTYIITNY